MLEFRDNLQLQVEEKDVLCTYRTDETIRTNKGYICKKPYHHYVHIFIYYKATHCKTHVIHKMVENFITAAAQEAVWLRNVMKGLNEIPSTVVHEDNQSVITIAKNPQYHSRTN